MDKAMCFLAMIIKMLNVIILFLLSKTQNYMFLKYLHKLKIIKNYQNFVAKDFKDQFIGKNIKQKVRIKIQQMNIDIFSNQIFFELIDYLY